MWRMMVDELSTSYVKRCQCCNRYVCITFSMVLTGYASDDVLVFSLLVFGGGFGFR